MSTYSLPSEAPCPQCGQTNLACEFDDGGNSVGDYTFVFTHTCPCGFSQSASHTIGYDQESRLDWLCDFCERDWLIASAQIDATRRGISISAAPPPPPDKPAEVLYESPPPETSVYTNTLSANAEFKRYLAAHPETLYTLNPRRFEELIADIFQDYGFDVELTPATRDGGVDIYACLHTPICTNLVVVECKLYQPDHHVGIDFVQRLHGVQMSKHANQGMLVTTSFFTRPAIAEARLYQHFMELKDYNHIKEWLMRYAHQEIRQTDPIGTIMGNVNMSILTRLSSQVGDRTESTNRKIVLETLDKPGLLAEIAAGLGSFDAALLGDCAEVMAQVAKQHPDWVAPYAEMLAPLLNKKTSRVRWEAMHALALIAHLTPNTISALLPTLEELLRSDSSVIVRDYATDAIAGYARSSKTAAEQAYPLLVEMLTLWNGKQAGHALKGLVVVAAHLPALRPELHRLANDYALFGKPVVRKTAKELLKATRA